MKNLYFYSLLIAGAAFILTSFQITRGRYIYRNQWNIPSHNSLSIKNSAKESLEVVLYNPSQTDFLQYRINNHEIKELPKNDSVHVTIDFAHEVFIVNNSTQAGPFRLKILQNKGRIKAALKDQQF